MNAEETFLETLYDLLIGAGKSKVDKVMHQFKEAKEELIEENEKLHTERDQLCADIKKPDENDYNSGNAWKDEMDHYQDSLKYIEHLESQKKELSEANTHLRNILSCIVEGS